MSQQQAQRIKLKYFDFPGEAETARIMLDYGAVPFEDCRIKEAEWPALKDQTPFGKLPVLEVDGKCLSEAEAIERYVGFLTELSPTDPWAAAKVDEAVALVDEVHDSLTAMLVIEDHDARTKKRQELIHGPIKTKFEMISQVLKDAGGEFLVGNLTNDKPTYADIWLYKTLCAIMGGDYEGVPMNLLDGFPELKKFHCRVAALPAISKRYEHATTPLGKAYKVCV